MTFAMRPELPGEAPLLRKLTDTAFAPMSYSDGTEGAALDQLRGDGDLTLSLVAVTEGGEVLGHVAFSPLEMPGSPGWFGLGPISVWPEHQGKGIGRALIDEGARLIRREWRAAGIALIGNPEVYRGSGFVSFGKLSYRDVPRQYVQHLHFFGPEPAGEIRFSAGLEGA